MRYYGLEEGLDVTKTAAKYGKELVFRALEDDSIEGTIQSIFTDYDTNTDEGLNQSLEAAGNWMVDYIINRIDPTPTQDYSLWLIRKYIDGGIRYAEDFEKANEYLTKFNKLKRKPRFKQNYSADINQYKTLSDLGEVILRFSDEDIQTKSEVENNFIKNNEVEIIYNTDEWKVVIPRTEEASCYFGRNTQWCTAATDSQNYFNSYSKEGPLYIVLNKPSNRRWQFQFETDEYMDENDRRIKIANFFKENPELIPVFGDKVDVNEDEIRVGRSFYNEDGILHRDKYPARMYGSFGESYYWFQNGLNFNDSGPSQYDISKDSVKLVWNMRDGRGNPDGPEYPIEFSRSKNEVILDFPYNTRERVNRIIIRGDEFGTRTTSRYVFFDSYYNGIFPEMATWTRLGDGDSIMEFDAIIKPRQGSRKGKLLDLLSKLEARGQTSVLVIEDEFKITSQNAFEPEKLIIKGDEYHQELVDYVDWLKAHLIDPKPYIDYCEGVIKTLEKEKPNWGFK